MISLRAIIFFSLYLIFTSSNAAEKSKIIKKLNSLDNIQFNFTQTTNEKIEKGKCTLVFLSKLKCNYDEIEKYADDIKTYHKEYCDNNYDIEDLIIQYYECIFEYKNFYNRTNTLFTPYNRIKYENFECEKLNKSLETINLDILIRQIAAIMKLKYEKIK